MKNELKTGGPSLGVRLKKAPRHPSKTRQRLVGSNADSIDRLETIVESPQTKVDPKWWESRFVLVLGLLGCVAMVALGL